MLEGAPTSPIPLRPPNHLMDEISPDAVLPKDIEKNDIVRLKDTERPAVKVFRVEHVKNYYLFFNKVGHHIGLESTRQGEKVADEIVF